MNEREQTCKTYFYLARRRISGLVSGLNKQFYAEGLRDIWSAFDAFLAWKYPDIHNRAMQENFARTYNSSFVKRSKSDRFKESITQLKSLAPVKDMSPINPNRDATLDNPDDLNELIYLLYRIRSNLDHGGKDLESDTPEAQRNRNLVEHGFKVTYEILERTLIDQTIID